MLQVLLRLVLLLGGIAAQVYSAGWVMGYEGGFWFCLGAVFSFTASQLED